MRLLHADHDAGLLEQEAAGAQATADVRPLPHDADPASLREALPALKLIELQFPKWTDGRAYSQAVLLRTRLGYRGELRAVGDVVADMVPLLQRTGFDSAVLRADQNPATAERTLGFFDGHYQNSVQGGP